MHWVSRSLAVLEAADEDARTPEEAAALDDAADRAEVVADYRRDVAAGRPTPAVIRSALGSDGRSVDATADGRSP